MEASLSWSVAETRGTSDAKTTTSKFTSCLKVKSFPFVGVAGAE